jgi:hypothetical protein
MMRSVLRMSRGQWTAGGLVFVAAILCGAVSARWAERAFPRAASAVTEAHTRTCVTLTGKRFQWNFPNPPFGTLSCSE